MTFTIHLLFASLAGIIFRPWFTTFCSCYMFCHYLSRKKSLFFMLSIWYCNWCLTIFFSIKFFHASTATFCSFCACYSERCFIPFLKSFSHVPHVLPFDDCRIVEFLSQSLFTCNTIHEVLFLFIQELCLLALRKTTLKVISLNLKLIFYFKNIH